MNLSFSMYSVSQRMNNKTLLITDHLQGASVLSVFSFFSPLSLTFSFVVVARQKTEFSVGRKEILGGEMCVGIGGEVDSTHRQALSSNMLFFFVGIKKTSSEKEKRSRYFVAFLMLI